MVPRATGSHRLLIGLEQPMCGRALVGGKGASLSELFALGAPVPAALALTTNAYAAVATALALPRSLAEAFPADLPRIREALLAAPLPAAVSRAILAAWRRLARGAGDEVALAVRSSATAEDSAEYSFAGLHDTVLDVRSVAALDAAIRACWASLWSDRAASYREAGPLARERAEIAVVVQKLVRADVSFVVFTADPVSGNRDHAVISASWGLGEAIVSGLVTPDHIVVNGAGEVIEYTIGGKETMIIAGSSPAEGIRVVPVPRVLRGVPVMTTAKAAEIAALARSIADRLGYPADIEGGIAADAIQLFQARPITTLTASAAAGTLSASHLQPELGAHKR